MDSYAKVITQVIDSLKLKPVKQPVAEELTKPNTTEPDVSDEVTIPNTTEESTISSDIQKVDIPKTGGVAPVSCTASLLVLLFACFYITSRKKNKY